MDVLVISYTISETGPTSQCILSVVERMEELGHSCRIVTRKGLVYDTADSYKCLEKGADFPSPRRSLYGKLIDYIKLYIPNKKKY